MKKICIVEDEKNIAEAIQLNLEMEGYEVKVFHHGGQAKSYFEGHFYFDLVILDVMLPEVSGLELCQLIRKKSTVPILFLSAKGTTADRVAGLKFGANDYLPKPFDLEEMLLKVSILTQSSMVTSPNKSERISIGEMTVDLTTFEVKNKDAQVVYLLSKKEADLLELFTQNVNRVISRDEILDKVWGTDQFPTSRTIDNYILVFRRLFESDPRNPEHFHSIRGVGYKFT
ncbi:MAG: hypothetical protein RL264_255 [Bacteroidota bacterium]|jgi:two-component system alkaline phosphatase synthesis response regulator PhoP